MPHKKIPKKIAKQLEIEKKELDRLLQEHPELFRKCGDKPCCQAVNKNGKMCSRPAFTDKTYIPKLKCCYLCWQHAIMYGVYVGMKLAKSMATAHMDVDEYCYYFPEECDEMLKTIQ